MFNVTISRGAVFHAKSKRRREVEYNAELRALTEKAVQELHALLRQSEVANLKCEIPKLPAARYIEGRCEECSLFEICLPRLTQAEAETEGRISRLARQLFGI